MPRLTESGDADYLAKVMPVMHRLFTSMAVLPDGTWMPIWSMLGTSAALIAAPGVVLSQQAAVKLVKEMAPEVIFAQ